MKNEVDVRKFIPVVLSNPAVKIDRETFLKKELGVFYPADVVDQALAVNPAYAGISPKAIERIAKNVISYETRKVSLLSFVTGIPGGFAAIGAVPADITQYCAFSLRVLQKLAYLYSFPDLELREDKISDEVLNELIIFLGIMTGASGANTGIKILSDAMGQALGRRIPRQNLMKTAWYPLLKKVAKHVGININKKIFARSVQKIVPVIGGVVSGSVSYITFSKSAHRLQKTLQELPLCDPEADIYK